MHANATRAPARMWWGRYIAFIPISCIHTWLASNVWPQKKKNSICLCITASCFLIPAFTGHLVSLKLSQIPQTTLLLLKLLWQRLCGDEGGRCSGSEWSWWYFNALSSVRVAAAVGDANVSMARQEVTIFSRSTFDVWWGFQCQQSLSLPGDVTRSWDKLTVRVSPYISLKEWHTWAHVCTLAITHTRAH